MLFLQFSPLVIGLNSATHNPGCFTGGLGRIQSPCYRVKQCNDRERSIKPLVLLALTAAR
jgi:hypothetical protein